MLEKTRETLRAGKDPLIVVLASDQTEVSLSAFKDEDTIVVASGVNAFSLFTGKPMIPAKSANGEVASNSAVSAEVIKEKLVAIATCDDPKCACTMYTTKEVAEAFSDDLATEKVKSIKCTACGADIAVASGESEEEESEDEDTSDEDLEDMSEDSESSDEEEEDISEFDGAEDSEDEEVMSEDESSEEDDESSEEVASFLEMIKASEDEERNNKMTEVSTFMHRIVSPTAKGVNFVASGEDIIAFEGAACVGKFVRNKAKPELAQGFSKPVPFAQSVSILIANGALATDVPSQEITDMGFQPIPVTVPVNQVAVDAITSEVTAKVEAASKAEVESAKAKYDDIAKNFPTLMEIAAVGVAKNVLDGGTNFANDLANILTTAGVTDAGTIVNNLMKQSFNGFIKTVTEHAKLLAEKGPAYTEGVAASVEKASYAFVDSVNNNKEIATAFIPNFVVNKPNTEVASERSLNKKTDVRSIFANMGRGNAASR